MGLVSQSKLVNKFILIMKNIWDSNPRVAVTLICAESPPVVVVICEVCARTISRKLGRMIIIINHHQQQADDLVIIVVVMKRSRGMILGTFKSDQRERYYRWYKLLLPSFRHRRYILCFL